MRRSIRNALLAFSVLGAASAALIATNGCRSMRSALVKQFTPDYEPADVPGSGLVAAYDGEDAQRPKIPISLSIVAEVVQPTAIEPVPGDPPLLIVLEQRGRALWHDLSDRRSGLWFETDVLFEASEQGLLGLAFHPQFTENGRFYTYATVVAGGQDVARISEWSMPAGADVRTSKPALGRTIIDVAQPYPNHNGGQIAFGPDGMLYAGYGDGGWRDDPHEHGQNPRTLLGAMIRIDVDRNQEGRAYAIPPDNPFAGDARYLPEVFAIGVRNPWRFSFAPDGRLVAGDVGQNLWEEVTFIPRGSNAGWNVREGSHCFGADTCPEEGFVDPIWDYGRDDGGCVTGGYVATGEHVPALAGKYVFGDFLTGRLWALDLPETGSRATKVHTLGRWRMLPSAFGRDAAGRIYVGDYSTGKVYRIDPAPAPEGSDE